MYCGQSNVEGLHEVTKQRISTHLNLIVCLVRAIIDASPSFFVRCDY